MPSADLMKALPDNFVALASSPDPIVVKATFGSWKILRGAHQVVGHFAVQEGDILGAISAFQIAQDFTDEVINGSVPPITEDAEPENDTELTVTLTTGTFSSVMASLAVVKANSGDDEGLSESGLAGKGRLQEAWDVFKPQMAAVAPGYGSGIE